MTRTKAAVVSEKGQVTIPKAVREALGIAPGTELAFEERDGCLVAKRVLNTSPFASLLGMGRGRDTDALLAKLRGPAWMPKVDE
jgi:AbrB family looped-hinge helix DNA binding protein